MAGIGACPPAMANCSGHGSCTNAECSCDDGWEGLLCAIEAPTLYNATTSVSDELQPGDWAYWVFPISDAAGQTVEIDVVMTQVRVRVRVHHYCRVRASKRLVWRGGKFICMALSSEELLSLYQCTPRFPRVAPRSPEAFLHSRCSRHTSAQTARVQASLGYSPKLHSLTTPRTRSGFSMGLMRRNALQRCAQIRVLSDFFTWAS
jgi:hypothetical protein